MDIYGIKNITNKELEFHYDSYYRQIAVALKKAETEEDRNKIRKSAKEKQNLLLENIEVDLEILKNNFINLIAEENSSHYLWILYSKWEAEENYIDKISDILKKENKVIRGGTNTYKMNGWMAHTLYVYQIVNYNIANRIDIFNFNGNMENAEQIQELHQIFNRLTKESKFLLKIFCLIHDIGVIEDITYHPELGSKYVETVLQEIELNQIQLSKNHINVAIKDLIKILQELIKCHTLITSLSAESSDSYVEARYRNVINHIPEVTNIKNDVPKLLLLLAYGDIIAVDESLMDLEKYQRTKECYHFFEQISRGEKIERDKEKVAIERICDTVGESNVEKLALTFDNIMKKYKIHKKQFMEDMYNIKFMRYTGPLMKTLKDMELTIKIYYELFELIGDTEGKEALKNYTIIFVPDKQENDFVEQFRNGNFFVCIERMKLNRESNCVYGNVNIVKEMDSQGKILYIKVV